MKWSPPLVTALASIALSVSVDATAIAQRQMERLDRGLVAVKGETGVFISWRYLATDPEDVAFNLYRMTGGDDPVRVNQEPVATATNFVDREADTAKPLQYFVRPVESDKELQASRAVAAWDKPYCEIPIDPLEGYRPGDASVADLDGDGQYEIVLHQVSRPRDNAHPGVTGTPILDAYEMDGARLWRIDLGINIREGQHYTQFLVYDLDGDGRAEIACKTATARAVGSTTRRTRLANRRWSDED